MMRMAKSPPSASKPCMVARATAEVFWSMTICWPPCRILFLWRLSHNPVYIQAMQIFREILPGVPMVAVFETGFHSTIPEHASTYGVPYEWREKYGVRRYGFHGSSHRYISQRVPELLVPAGEGPAAYLLPPGRKFFHHRH